MKGLRILYNWSDSSNYRSSSSFFNYVPMAHMVAASEYTTGVTYNTPGSAGAYTSTITVAVGAPTLYTYCQCP